MPIVFSRDFTGGVVALWRVVESLPELMDGLTEEEQAYCQALGSDARRKEFAAWRNLARILSGAERIVYDNAGGPCFADPTKGFIGVSHTVGYVAVIICDSSPCAVDVERVGRDVSRVRSRYVSDQERSLEKGDNFDLSLWCAKEVAYKFYRRAGIDFLADMQLTSYLEAKTDECIGNPMASGDDACDFYGRMMLSVLDSYELGVDIYQFADTLLAYSFGGE